MNQKVFLTGGSGRIGRLVLRNLLDRGYLVRALVHRKKPEISDKNLEIVEGDILDQEQMRESVKDCQMICHLAAAWDMFPPAVFERENNQLFDSVIRGTYNLLEAAYKAKGLNLFLYASTDAVYATGLRKFSAPITEETELFPSRFYALAKIVCETMCIYYGKLYNLPWLIFRICWTLHIDELPTLLSYEFWEGLIDQEDRDSLKSKIGNGKGIFAPLMANGESGVDQIADPQDIADGIVKGLESSEKAKNNVYNLAGPAPFKYLEIVRKLAEKFNLQWDSAPVKGIEPYEIVIEKARRVLGYNPRFTAEMMFERALKKKIHVNTGSG